MADTVDLRPITRAIDSVRIELSNQIDGVTTEVGQVRQDLRLANDELKELRTEFNEYVKAAARTAAVQISTTQVGNLKAELDREFGHYAVVRRTSIGTLQSFDLGLVSNDVVASVSEELMIQTPRYWLAPALVGIAAWSRDDKEIADKAVQEAFARDKNKTSLFFALVLRRQGRIDGSVRWLRHYLDSLDPTALTREFAVVLEAASYEAFGPAGQQLATERIRTWIAHMRSDDAVIEQQVKRWTGEIGMQRGKLDVTQYQTLAKIAPDFGKLRHQIESASALPAVTEKYEEIKNHSAPMPSVLEDLLDDILDTLVTEYDEEELPLRREVVYHESVIHTQGDIDEARKRSEELQRALDESIDIVSLQTEAAINPDSLGVSKHTQRISIGISVGEFRSAVNRFTTEYRGRAVEELTYVLDDKHSNYASTFRFTGATIASSLPEADGEAAITAAWHTTMEAFIKAAQFKPNKHYVRGAVALAAAILCMLINPIFGILVLLVAGGAVASLAYREKVKAEAAVKSAEESRQRAIEHSILMYREAGAQLVDARDTYHELDGQESGLLNLIDAWPTAAREEAA